MTDKVCIICGKSYLARDIRGLTCSPECRKQYDKQYYKAHKEKKLQYQKERQKTFYGNGIIPEEKTQDDVRKLWLKQYKKADRLGQVAMVLRVWNDTPGNKYITYGAWQNMSKEGQFKIISSVLAVKEA